MLSLNESKLKVNRREKMGLVNEVNTTVENERIEKVKSIFDGYDDDEMVYCIVSMDCSRLYSVCSDYKVATTIQKTYRSNTSLWFVSVNKAREHFIRCLLVKNTEKLHKENEKLMTTEKIEKIADKEEYLWLIAKTLTKAIAIQSSYIRLEKLIKNGEKNCKFYPFNDTASQSTKEYYFKRYLQRYGSN